MKAFFEEHIHDSEEIRYVLGGSGYFDVRSKSDAWIRIHVQQGNLMTLPEGIYHRITVDEGDRIRIHAMRLFREQPVWTPFNRPCDEHESRKSYVRKCENNANGCKSVSVASEEEEYRRLRKQ